MALTKVTGGPVTYIGPKNLEVGQTVSGIFLGLTEPDQFDKENFKLEGADGELIIVNRSGQLAFLMNRVPIGAQVNVTYRGKQVIATGRAKGKEAHQWEVAYDSGEVGSPPKAAASASKRPF